MTFRNHNETILAHKNDISEDFQPSQFPGWSADSYIVSKCPNIKRRYRFSYSSRYGYLYKLIRKGLISAVKADGLWFYSRESIDQLEEILTIRETLSSDNVSQWNKQRKEINSRLLEVQNKKANAKTKAASAMIEAKEALEHAHNLMREALELNDNLESNLESYETEEKTLLNAISASEEALQEMDIDTKKITKWVKRPYNNWQLSDYGVPEYELNSDGNLIIQH
jgi:hypothetical protein